MADPNWYPDTNQPGYERWWDGTRWTESVRPIGGAPVPSDVSPQVLQKRKVNTLALLTVPLGLLTLLLSLGSPTTLVFTVVGSFFTVSLCAQALSQIRGEPARYSGKSLALTALGMACVAPVLGVIIWILGSTAG